MVDRATQTVPARAAPTKKGMRQPQLARSASLSEATVSADTPTASKRADLARRGGQEAIEAAPMRRRAFQQVGDYPGIFAADREAHHAAQQDQQPAPAAGPICE